MGINHKKNWKIISVIIINTLLVLFIIGYDKRNITTYNTEIQMKDGENIITVIWNVEDYVAFAESVTKDNDYEYYEVTLYADLDFSGYENFPVIGVMEDVNDNMTFKGVFNGYGDTF